MKVYVRSLHTEQQNIIYTLTCHTDPALLIHPTASVYKTDHICRTQKQLFCSQPQHTSLSMHINMHYTPSTTHPTAFHNLLCTPGRQNGTRCRDGAKLLSFPSSLIFFLGFHPYMCLFSFRKLFVTCDKNPMLCIHRQLHSFLS